MSQVSEQTTPEYHTIPFNADAVSVQRCDLCYIMVNFPILTSENEGVCSCAQILLLDYTEKKWGHSHRSSSHLLFILPREARKNSSYSCAQRKQAWPLCQMASELFKVIMQLEEYKAFLSESCSSFPWLRVWRVSEFLSPFVTSISTSKELILHCKSHISTVHFYVYAIRIRGKKRHIHRLCSRRMGLEQLLKGTSSFLYME